jgi:hypothetical protein
VPVVRAAGTARDHAQRGGLVSAAG